MHPPNKGGESPRVWNLLNSGLEQPIANWASGGNSTWGTGVMPQMRAEKGIPGCWGSAGS